MNLERQQMDERLANTDNRTRRGAEAFIRSLNTPRKIGEIALKNGLLTHRQLGEALAAQRRLRRKGRPDRLGEILVRSKVLTPGVLNSLLE